MTETRGATPRQPPRTLARLLVVLLAMGAYLAWDQTRAWELSTNPDSAGYVRNEETRGWTYPLLIDLVVPRSIQDAPSRWGWREKQTPAAAFQRLVLVQRLIMLAAVGLSCWVLSRRGLLVPLGMVAGAALFDLLLARDLFPGIERWVGSVNPEALTYPWEVLLFVLAWAATESPSRTRLIALGTWAALGVDLAARLLPFCMLTLAPAAGAWIGRRSGSRAGPALLAVGVCVALVGLRCAVTHARFGVLAPVPYNGFSSIGVALQFADASDERLFERPREKKFLERCLGDDRRRPSDPMQGNTFATSFVNTNTWVIGWPAYKEIWGDVGIDRALGNRVLAGIARKLLFADGDNFRRWMSWAAGACAYCVALRWPTALVGLASLVAALLLRRRAPPALLALLVLLPLTHVANIVVSVSLQGILPRYILSSEFLLLGVFGVALALAGGKSSRSPSASDRREREASLNVPAPPSALPTSGTP